jgi:hypothetical protein
MFVVNSWATTFEVFLHRDIGSRYLGPNALGGFLLIPFFLIFFEGYDGGPMVNLWLVFIAMCAMHRWSFLWRRRKSPTHSFYTGWPWLLPEKYSQYEVKFKQIYEPMLILALGFPMTVFSPPVGMYMIVGSFCLGMKVGMGEFLTEQRSLDMNDAVVEQQLLAERFRRRYESKGY